ncbi:gamma-glutamyl-gamma-aminobutyrate hydrolase family protein [Oceanobacillus polygoni]|uniref:Glutamine amidotransferase n=1 Tax=Oceanobacillus polygoni TaxID=1235259 RepID=A0A9X0YVV1_9BACI|nr:gamma-glutamyl-gamma-aminobutyrate hydrolase family protein [Oceanobacillus polygoni]MBP2079757.1 putative glutamine amidotransferase [Oceanobacillus polygoni]
MKPIIGITVSMETNRDYYSTANRNVKVIIRAGGIPILLPYLIEEGDVVEIVNRIDGLYATGGGDIDPILFGEEPHLKLGLIIPERDQSELILIQKMLEMNKPILGVCRGSQILNIAAGGDMYQDIYSQMDKELLQHSQKAPFDYGSHFVHVRKDSLLYKLTGEEKLRVNSYHHQANRVVPKEFRISGTASDGVIEAIESKSHPFVLGLQWHPEGMVEANDAASLKIYERFIDACISK